MEAEGEDVADDSSDKKSKKEVAEQVLDTGLAPSIAHDHLSSHWPPE